MPNMIIDGTALIENPSEIPQLIQAKPIIHSAVTLTSVVVFVWPSQIEGVRIRLTWDIMSTGQYNTLFALFDAATTISFDPQDGTSRVFDILIEDFDGEYFIFMENEAGNHRQNVYMDFVIIGIQ